MSLRSWKEAGAAFRFGEHEVFYRADGSGRTALLCIHGFPTASWDWEPLWPALRKRFAQVLAPDLLGFGWSAKPRHHDYSLLEQADLCEALLAERGVDRVHILAHDYGVSVAQELLARELSQPRRRVELLSVVFLNGGLFPETHRALWTQKALNGPLGFLVTRLLNERRFGSSFSRVFGPDTRPGLIELHDFWQLVSHDGGHHLAHRLIRYIGERSANRERWVGALQRSRVPLRLINGPEDPVSGAHMVARYQEIVPAADAVLIPGVGHYPQVEAPDRVLKAFLEFHDRLSGEKRGRPLS
ncbi:MAG TPA: alpha/beta hydrolase [Solimonas sp.]|nr:alpha/beta hydrolase [Solimonas sp.]